MKAEKYEKDLEVAGLEDKKVDVESLDGRINFLVNTLEEYRRILEEDSAFKTENLNKTHSDVYLDLDRLDEKGFITPNRRSAKSLLYTPHVENEKTLNTGTMSSDQ